MKDKPIQTWRQIAAPIIHEVIERVGRDDEKMLRKALRDAYPFGERAYWPYKVWLDEIKCQLGQKTFGAGKLRPCQGQRELF